MEVKLSILICTTSARSETLCSLLKELEEQRHANHYHFNGLAHNPTELIINNHETDNVGKKRNDLLKQAVGQYIVFIDDDDEISPNYIALILQALESNPDCVGINGKITTNGINERQWFISMKYPAWFEQGGVYFRTPNHISPVRRELALQAGFPEIAFAEDHEYSRRLHPLLKTEVLINEPIYWYKYDDRK